MNFIEEKKWLSLEEIPAWKSPASFQMSVLSQFFKVCFFRVLFYFLFIFDSAVTIQGVYQPGKLREIMENSGKMMKTQGKL